jgi:hypothetical protein
MYAIDNSQTFVVTRDVAAHRSIVIDDEEARQSINRQDVAGRFGNRAQVRSTFGETC